MTINGTDITQFHAILLSKHIQPATVTTYTDWLRQGPNPLNYGRKETFKSIKLTIYLEDATEDAVADDISNLMTALKSCTLKFDDLTKYFDCTIADSLSDPDTMIAPGIHQLDVTLNSSYAYLPAVTVSLASASQIITAQGNLPSPAVVTLTPTQDIGAVTLTGLSKKPIKVLNLHANAPVTIDGEACTVTEPDIETVLTEAQGAGKWMMRKYQAPNIFSPDVMFTDFVPTKDIIPADTAYTQRLIADSANLYQDDANNYLVHLKTGLYVASAKSITLKFLHDDGVNVILNGTSIYASGKAEDNAGNPGYPSVSLPLVAGWNALEILVLNHFGAGGVWGIQTALASQVDQLNAYYARDANSTGTVNKFPDTDFWQFPALQPGSQTVTSSIALATCGVSIQYKPKSM